MKKPYIKEIKSRSIKGVFFNGLSQAISLVAGFILSIFLSAEIFGIFTVVAATAAFLNYFSDIGLAAVLIQKKDKITEDDLATTFTIQQIIALLLIIISFLLSGWVASIRGFSHSELWLFRILIIAFFLSSLKTIPSILLERELRFKELAIPQILEVVVFNSIVVYLALRGWGIEMFSVAVLVRGIVGLVAIYWIRFWRPRLYINKKSALKLISFGIPFQLNSILALFKDQIFVMFLPVILPIYQLGYIGWAKKWAEFPLRLIMDNIVKVTFPTYSRLQGYPEKLTKAINKTMFALLFFVIPFTVGMLYVINPLVQVIPRYEKWTPALLSFYLFTISASFASISTPLINALNAIKKINISLKFMVFWTFFLWIGTFLLVPFAGFNAVAITSALMGVTSIVVVFVSKKYLNFNLSQQLIPPLICSIIMAIILSLIRNIFTWSLITIGIYIFIGGCSYLISFFILFRKKLLVELKYFFSIIRKRA